MDPAPYVRNLPHVFEHLRATFGPDLAILHDVHHRLTPIQAARLGKSLEEYDPFWLEDVTPAENQESLRLVRQHTTVPLATGEIFNSVVDYLTLFSEQLLDYARSAVTHAGGVTGLRRILDVAAIHQIKSAIHGPTDISPIGLSAALHIDTAIHNFGIQEFMQHVEQTNEVFDSGYSFTRGSFQPGERPGLGVRFDRAAAVRFPYKQAYLPVNRLADGDDARLVAMVGAGEQPQPRPFVRHSGRNDDQHHRDRSSAPAPEPVAVPSRSRASHLEWRVPGRIEVAERTSPG